MKSFIEVQFPISRLSAECQKERKSNVGQTLTGLGKWWGRKPLILVRATILGLLMPASDNSIQDMEIFLKILTMDDDGLWLRNKNKKKFTREEFDSMTYSERLAYCIRPEHVENLPDTSWSIINEYLHTNASNIQELINELGQKKFGHTPKVGDVFCGGGSIPFESARIGCETYASDLNPVATMLTWASLNLLSKSDKDIEELEKFQTRVYNAVKQKVDELGIEKNENNETADYYLYCNETQCPHCNTEVPLAPNWVISTKSRTIAKLIPNGKNYLIDIINNSTEEEFKQAKHGTIVKGKMICPNCHNITPIATLRGDKKTQHGTKYGLRMWTNEDIVAKDSDVFKERLYCIRYVDANGDKKYVTPTQEDFKREETVLLYVKQNFNTWQSKGYIPSDKIIVGYNTEQPIRERGWMYWHHLFNPRQLMLNALINTYIDKIATKQEERVLGILGLNKSSDFNSRLSIWDNGVGGAGTNSNKNALMNKALNTSFNYACRGTLNMVHWFIKLTSAITNDINYQLNLSDARCINSQNDIWITDPPYADAVNYHELTEFFLSWDKQIISKTFPEWYANSKRELAVKGADQSFVDSMIDVYSHLTNHMNNCGYQVIMFTHQDVKVWSDLVPIIVKSGLEVCQAWTISTETECGGLKKDTGFVQGTVLLILKKRQSDLEMYSDQLYEEIDSVITTQIQDMQSIDFYDNFQDNDYILSSYAAGLKVLTSCTLMDINIDNELNARQKHAINKIDDILNHANDCVLKILIPKGIDKKLWNNMTKEERFYIQTLYNEMNGNTKMSPIMESAKVFGLTNYKSYLEHCLNNNARIKTATELKSTLIYNDKFGNTLLRHTLKAICESVENNNLDMGKQWLSTHTDYTTNATSNKYVLSYLKFILNINNLTNLHHWEKDCEFANALYIMISNERV